MILAQFFSAQPVTPLPANSAPQNGSGALEYTEAVYTGSRTRDIPMHEVKFTYNPLGAAANKNYGIQVLVELLGAAKRTDQAVIDDIKAAGNILLPRIPLGGVLKSVGIAELGADGRVLKTKSDTFYVDAPGTWEPPAGFRMAPLYRVVQMRKNAPGGPAGVIQLRGCITVAEMSAYDTDRSIPARYAAAANVAATTANNFGLALYTALTTARMKIHMPDRFDDQDAIVKRPVGSIVWGGIAHDDETNRKKGFRGHELEGAQQRINALGRAARSAYKKDSTGEIPDDAKQLVADAKNEAKAIRAKLENVLRPRIKMPAIFDVTEV